MADDIELGPKAGGTSKMKIAIAVVLGVVVAVGGTIGALFAMGVLPPSGPQAVDAQAADEAEPEPPEDAVYVSLDPAFTVNFTDQGSVRYLQLTVQAMTRDPDMEPEIKRHMPVIRNDLMLLFSAQSSETLNTREGKEGLQAEALASIQGILERETGSPGVEAVYFTSFMMQ